MAAEPQNNPAPMTAEPAKPPQPAPAPAPASDPPGGGSQKKLMLGGAIVLLLNYVLTTMFDDSGLHIVMVTASLSSAIGNATAREAFIAGADLLGDHGNTFIDMSDSGAMRFELMEHRDTPAMAAPSFVVSLVHWRRQEDVRLPAWLDADLTVESTRRFTTVFPEAARWKPAPIHPEPRELGEVGRVALLVQERTMIVKTEHAASVRLGWSDLGYNALGEPGVVRCDLLLAADGEAEAAASATTTFVARKVFRNAAALDAHEQSEHFTRWHEATAPMLQGKTETRRLDTLLPRSSPFPFRTRWAA